MRSAAAEAHAAFADLDRFSRHKLIANAATNLKALDNALKQPAFERLFHAEDVNAFTLAFYLSKSQIDTGYFVLDVLVHLIVDQDLVLVVLGEAF